jgi:hypothetical protein
MNERTCERSQWGADGRAGGAESSPQNGAGEKQREQLRMHDLTDRRPGCALLCAPTPRILGTGRARAQGRRQARPAPRAASVIGHWPLVIGDCRIGRGLLSPTTNTT